MHKERNIPAIRLRRHFIFLISIWTLANLAFLISGNKVLHHYFVQTIKKNSNALNMAFKNIYYADLTQHGIYSKTGNKLQPNTAYQNYKNKDLITTSGDTLTIISPYKTFFNLFQKIIEEQNIKVHISNQLPLSPSNYSYDWESNFVKKLGDLPIYGGFYENNNQKYYRFISPLEARESCIKCHSNFTLNEKMGIISFVLPINKLSKKFSRLKNYLDVGIFILWVIGIFIIGYSYTRLDLQQKEITEKGLKLAENEDKLKLIINNISDVIWQLDTNLNYIYISPSIKNMTGYTPEEYMNIPLAESHTERSFKLLMELFIEQKENNFQNKIKEIPINFVQEEEIIHKDNHIIYTEFSASFLFDKNKKLVGLQGVTRDISERKKFIEKIESSEKKLKELIQTKDKFFSIIAHDLKNPFNSLMGFTSLLSENYTEFSETKRVEFISVIEKSAKQAYNLVQNLLEWARTQTGKINFTPENINLRMAVQNSINVHKLNIESKSITLIISIDELLIVYADKNMLNTILDNLISNAIKFTENNGKIEIKAQSEQRMVQISVIDNGVGIAPENIEKLFKIDKNFSTTGTEGEKGTGLGLILCSEFISKNYGKLWINEEYKNGTEIIFTLPKVRIT